MIDKEEIQNYLHEHIPLSRAMGVSVVRADTQEVELSAPLEPNINHRETVFGGSASALAILAAWTLLHLRLTGAGINARLVIQSNNISYDRPIVQAFEARCVFDDTQAWGRFVKILQRKGKARIAIASSLHCAGETVASLQGNFVALAVDKQS